MKRPNILRNRIDDDHSGGIGKCSRGTIQRPSTEDQAKDRPALSLSASTGEIQNFAVEKIEFGLI